MPPLDASPTPTVLGEIQPTPRKARGRPRKPSHKTPVDIAEFDSVVAIIKAIPEDRHPAVRERARQLAGQDARLSRGPLVLLNRLIDADWATGISTKSIAKLADECGLDRRTITRAFQSLGEAGHTLRRRKESDRGDLDLSETTLPLAARAWSDISTGVGAEKSEGRGEKIGGRGVLAPTVGANNAQPVGANNAGRGEKIAALPSPDPWSDPRLLDWVDDDETAQAAFKTEEVEQLTATLARGLTNEFLGDLVAKSLPELDATLRTDAGLDAFRTLIAGVIVARNPSDGGEVVVDDEMLLSAMKRVFDVVFHCGSGADGPVKSYKQPGTILVSRT